VNAEASLRCASNSVDFFDGSGILYIHLKVIR
jgi:hypothetical protein